MKLALLALAALLLLNCGCDKQIPIREFSLPSGQSLVFFKVKEADGLPVPAYYAELVEGEESRKFHLELQYEDKKIEQADDEFKLYSAADNANSVSFYLANSKSYFFCLDLKTKELSRIENPLEVKKFFGAIDNP